MSANARETDPEIQEALDAFHSERARLRAEFREQRRRPEIVPEIILDELRRPTKREARARGRKWHA